MTVAFKVAIIIPKVNHPGSWRKPSMCSLRRPSRIANDANALAFGCQGAEPLPGHPGSDKVAHSREQDFVHAFEDGINSCGEFSSIQLFGAADDN